MFGGPIFSNLRKHFKIVEMWLFLLSLGVSGVAVGIGFFIKYLHQRTAKKYSELSKTKSNELSDGYVFVRENDTLSSTIDESRFDQYNFSTIGRDSDCELIDEINALVTTS